MKQTKKRFNRTVQKILQLARERNLRIHTKKSRPYYFYAGKRRRNTRRRFKKMRGGNNSSSSSIPTEITVPFVDKNNTIQNTYSKLVSGTLQAQENGNV